MSETEKPDLTTLTVQLLSAYVGNNSIPSSELADLVRSTRAALAEDVKPAAAPAPQYVPAVSVRASLASRDHIISLIDGKRYKSLKRHLSSNGLTPAEYRVRYNLAHDYPMVAPNYSAHRREVAQKLGLGRKKVEAVADTATAEPAPTPRKRTARPKAAASTTSQAKRASKGKQRGNLDAA